jgi:predicted nucleotidyltransferase
MTDISGRFESILRAHRVALAYAFGSARGALVSALKQGARPESAPMSDLDLGVVFRPPIEERAEPPHLLHSRLHVDLVDLLPALDLILLEQAHSLLQADAISGTCVFAASEDYRLEYELGILRRAADFRYHYVQFHRERREAER